MAYDLKIPSVGESITAATIAKWHKANGDYIHAGEEVLTIETDKVSQTLEAQVSGILHHLVTEGDEVNIGAVVASIDESVAAPDGAAVIAPVILAPKAEITENEAKATSVASAIAGDRGIDLSKLKGSGPGGKITKIDVMSASPNSGGLSENGGAKRTTRQKMTPLRRKIADHLVNAQHDAAILTTFNECNMHAVMTIRKQVQDRFVEKYGVKLGFMSIFLKAVVGALQTIPMINARIEGDEIVTNHFFDIGVAVGTEKGLVVPVVRDVDKKSLAELESDIANYAKKARDGKIQLSDLQGGVFTVTNGGTYGSLLSTPIINPPQAGILGMHSIQERPIAEDGQVVIRPMMYLALSYDHRIVDGKEAVTFLVKLKQGIESPELILAGI